jgi:hypothetical protein
MQRTFLGQLAAIEVEVFHGKFRAFKKGVAGQELLQTVDRAVFQPGKGQVRSELFLISWNIYYGE